MNITPKTADLLGNSYNFLVARIHDSDIAIGSEICRGTNWGPALAPLPLECQGAENNKLKYVPGT